MTYGDQPEPGDERVDPAPVLAEDVVAEDVVAEDVVAEDVVAEDVVAEDVVAEDVVAEDVVADEPVSGASDPRIAGALAQLEGLADASPAEHVEVYEQVHRVLQDALADARDGAAQGNDQSPGGRHP